MGELVPVNISSQPVLNRDAEIDTFLKLDREDRVRQRRVDWRLRVGR